MRNIKIILFTLLTALVLTGCNKGCNKSESSPVITHTITANQITDIMGDVGVMGSARALADSTYALPSERWVQNQYASALYSFLNTLKSSQWVAEENDCDNFASLSFSFAQILHHNTPNKGKNVSLAFGEFWYVSRSGPHAINVFITRIPPDSYKVGFFEPQTQKTVVLTYDEISSCAFYRF
jgi:hypothetical protein